MTRLLVSVRSAEEAESAVSGGAHVIDVKEPNRGSLGRSDLQTLASVLEIVGGRRQVSAALGELRENGEALNLPGLDYAKWGLAGYAREPEWRQQFLTASERLTQASPSCQVVVVAYADFEAARAPSLDDVLTFALNRQGQPFLVDTFQKKGQTLRDYLSDTKIAEVCQKCRAAGTPVALAGSLRYADLDFLRKVCPDWVAVRSAVCPARNRLGSIDSRVVRKWTEALRSVCHARSPSVDRPEVHHVDLN